MTSTSSMPVGVVIARHKLDNPWQDYAWRPEAVIAGAPAGDPWRELASGEGWIQYLAGTVTLELHRKETEAYKYNLECEQPMLYVVLSADDDPDSPWPVKILTVTASPFEAQNYLDSGEEIVEAVTIPAPIHQWMADFVAEHHVEEQFRKRKRDSVKIEDHKFGQEPLSELRRRMADQDSNG